MFLQHELRAAEKCLMALDGGISSPKPLEGFMYRDVLVLFDDQVSSEHMNVQCFVKHRNVVGAAAQDVLHAWNVLCVFPKFELGTLLWPMAPPIWFDK